MITKPKYYLYAYGHPVTGKIFYIGKGSGNRYLVHLTYAKKDKLYNRNPYMMNKIKKILRDNKLPLIHRFCFSDDEAMIFDAEIKAINRIGLSNLCNLREGGDGARVTEVSKKKIGQTLKKYYSINPNPFKGKKHTKESIELIKQSLVKYKEQQRERARERTYSETTKEKMSASAKKREPSFLGKHHSEETKKRISRNKTGIKQSQDTIEKRRTSIQSWWDMKRGIAQL